MFKIFWYKLPGSQVKYRFPLKTPSEFPTDSFSRKPQENKNEFHINCYFCLEERGVLGKNDALLIVREAEKDVIACDFLEISKKYIFHIQ